MMKAVVKSITGFEDMFVAMYLSKRSWTTDLDNNIRNVCNRVLDRHGQLRTDANEDDLMMFNDWFTKSLNMGKKHITILRFLDISIMTEGMHRGGQDDIDSHARRFDNRIIRNSTRLATFSDGEVSDYYKDKILTTDETLQILGIEIPERFEHNGNTYIKSPNGYIQEQYKDNKDVMRGLYMLSIPSNFVSKINLCEWAHVFKQRNADGHANPEVKEWAESITTQLTEFHSLINRDYVLSVDN